MGSDLPAEALIADSSALVPLVVAEDQSMAVRALLLAAPFVATLDLTLSEVANALWAKVRRGLLGAADARAALQVASRRIDRLVSGAAVADRALELALAHDHSAYDCFYVALAERERRPLVTCDRRLAETFAAVAEIRLLGPAPPPAAPKPRRRR